MLNVSFRTTSAISRISSEHDEKYTVKDGNQIQTQIPATVTRKEKSLEERLISGGDKHLSWRKGREEKTLFDVSRKQKQFVSKKWYSLLGGNASPELLRGELFKVLLS